MLEQSFKINSTLLSAALIKVQEMLEGMLEQNFKINSTLLSAALIKVQGMLEGMVEQSFKINSTLLLLFLLKFNLSSMITNISSKRSWPTIFDYGNKPK